MRNISLLILYIKIILGTLFLVSCQNDNVLEDQTGEVIVKFDNYVGNQQLIIDEVGSTNYRYTNKQGQSFNVTRFGYYISHVKLEGPNGEYFEDEVHASANASDIRGYYRVVQGEPETYNVHLKNVPAGQYNKIVFNLGVKEDGIIEGAVGGILDRGAGAWFWNWNSGFIHWMFEGHSPESPRTQGELQNRVRYHVGGWKNISPDAGQAQRFFDNNVAVSLPFDATVRVSESMRPSPHIHMDVLNVLGDADFEVSNNIHSPAEGRPFAMRIPQAFIVDHTHQ